MASSSSKPLVSLRALHAPGMIPNEIAGGQGPESAVSFDFQKRMLHDDRRRPSSRWKGVSTWPRAWACGRKRKSRRRRSSLDEPLAPPELRCGQQELRDPVSLRGAVGRALRGRPGRPRRTQRLGQVHPPQDPRRTDRKSTRLNSSHVKISYAVFCLKKKKENQEAHHRIVQQTIDR